MFYVKEKISPAAQITIQIHYDNVFCICPECGCEINVNLVSLLSVNKAGLYDTAVFCKNCSKLKLKNLKK